MIARDRWVAAVPVVACLCHLAACSGAADPDSTQAVDTTGQVAPARTIDDEQIRTSLEAAEEYFNAGDNANARVILARLVRDAPEVLEARELLGQVFAAEAAAHDAAGREEQAAESRMRAWEQYQEAVKLAPQQPGLHHSAALMALAAGRREAAVDLLRQAMELDRTNTQYPLYLAQLYLQDGRLDEAASLVDDALEVDPNEPHLHATNAAIALERGDFETALEQIRSARGIAPEETSFRVQEAKILRRSGQPREALTLLTSLPEEELRQEFVAWEIAAGYKEIGDSTGVARAWERCFRADPLHPNAWLWAARVGEAELESGHVAAATMWLNHAHRLNPLAPEVLALEAALEEAGENESGR